MKKLFHNISFYDKNDNLIKYFEYTENREYIKCFYEVDGNFVNRKFLQNLPKETNQPEILSSIIEYSDNVMLFPLCLDGEVYMQTILSGQTFTSINPPKIKNSIYSTQVIGNNNADIENFTMNSNLIYEYLNKL